MNFSLEIVGDFFDDYLMKLNNYLFRYDHDVVGMFFFSFVLFFIVAKTHSIKFTILTIFKCTV